MKKRLARPALWAAVTLAVIVIVVVLRFDFSGNLTVDACEDAGGRWDTASASCAFSHEQP